MQGVLYTIKNLPKSQKHSLFFYFDMEGLTCIFELQGRTICQSAQKKCRKFVTFLSNRAASPYSIQSTWSMRPKLSFKKLQHLDPPRIPQSSQQSFHCRSISCDSEDPYILDTAILPKSKQEEEQLRRQIRSKRSLSSSQSSASSTSRVLFTGTGSFNDCVLEQSWESQKQSGRGSGESKCNPADTFKTATLKTSGPKKKQNKYLKKIVEQQRIKQLCRKFISKLKRNNVESPAVEYEGFDKENSSSWMTKEGIEVEEMFDNGVALVSIIQIVVLFVMYTLSLVFRDLRASEFLDTLQKFSLAFYLLEIVYTCLTVKSFAGRKITKIGDILSHYLEQGLVMDLINLFILIFDVNTDTEALLYLRLLVLLKLPQCLSKMEKLEIYFIKNYYYEQYWSLAKVFIFNFCFAHLLAILLTAMAGIDQTNNWQVTKGIESAQWQQRYIWAYYWSANIMLTVGFGDIAASTHHEALCLVFIEFVSVICLAYNINWVGTLISNIRAQDIEKGKNFKTFKQLADKYNLEPELEWKINNYIEESVNIRKKFNVEEENQFLDRLPKDLKVMYLKQSNRSLFQELPFFSQLVDQTLSSFAQQIQMHISHPEETLRSMDDDYNLLILRDGKVGYSTKRRNCNYNEMVMDQVSVKQTGNPFLLGLEFLTRFRPPYQIKSLVYSVIYCLDYEKLINTLKESTMDYMHFCFLRDKNRSVIDQFEVVPCDFCPGQKHTKFTCPKLHFIPMSQHVIHKQMHRNKVGKCRRRSAYSLRDNKTKSSALRHRQVFSQMTEAFEDTVKTEKMNMVDIKRRPRSNRRIAKRFEDKLDPLMDPEGKTIESTAKQVKAQEQDIIWKTSEIIKEELNKMNSTNKWMDEVWLVKSDEMKNFKDYFPERNPCSLEEYICPKEPESQKTTFSKAFINYVTNSVRKLEEMDFQLDD